MTSNLGSEFIEEFANEPEQQHDAVHGVLKQSFRPEFLNRVDDIVIFQHLNKEELIKFILVCCP